MVLASVHRGSDETVSPVREVDLKQITATIGPEQAMECDHVGLHPQLNLSLVFEKFAARHAQTSSRWLKLNIMRHQKIAVPYILAAIGIAVAIWATMGAPPRSHPKSTTRQFAGPPSFAHPSDR
jgi:hypothetical protein